ncbi:hypothetical protein [Enterococcus sp. LJL51]|uniref:hypothetical protein n=1 Tax=Enterococcus sp. LJL51 TaxID=3416656 RepID=UPI003CFA24C1
MDSNSFESIIRDLEQSEDLGDVNACKNSLIELYEEMEAILFDICNEDGSNQLKIFKERYFPTDYSEMMKLFVK